MILTGEIGLVEPDGICCAIAMPAPSPALRAPSPNGRGSADRASKPGPTLERVQEQLFTAPASPSQNNSIPPARSITFPIAATAHGVCLLHGRPASAVFTDGQDGAGRLADDPLGDRAQQDMAEAGPAVGGDDDQVDAVVDRIRDDRLDRASPPHRRDDRSGLAPGGVEQPVERRRARSSFSL